MLQVSVTVVYGQMTIKGMVADQRGDPMLGVTVFKDGTSYSTSTGTNGDFSIKVAETSTKLMISYIGYQTV